MKKVISLLLALVLCISLCACGKSKAIKEVETLIDAIGEVTADSETAVLTAEKAYDALTTEESEQVENYSALMEAREALDSALYEKHVNELLDCVSCEWANVNDMDRYVFQQDGTGTHEGKNIEFTIDPENMLLSVTEGVTGTATQEFKIDLEYKTPRLIPQNAVTYYVEAKN